MNPAPPVTSIFTVPRECLAPAVKAKSWHADVEMAHKTNHQKSAKKRDKKNAKKSAQNSHGRAIEEKRTGCRGGTGGL
jgi:hypothetical protein